MSVAVGSLLVAGCGEDEAALPATNVAPPNATSPSETSVAPQPTELAAVTDSSPEITPVETPSTPLSITSPTIPYTLPPDYGEAPTITRGFGTAPPRSTYPPDSVLPPVEWIVDDTVTVRFAPPADSHQDPRPLSALDDYSRANGLYVLERWWVPDEASMATFSVQVNPGKDSPLLVVRSSPTASLRMTSPGTCGITRPSSKPANHPTWDSLLPTTTCTWCRARTRRCKRSSTDSRSSDSSTGDLWAWLNAETITRSVLRTVLPDDDTGDDHRGNGWLVPLAQGLEATADDLRHVPYEVVVADGVQRRLQPPRLVVEGV